MMGTGKEEWARKAGISPDLQMLLSSFILLRHFRGKRWCRKNGVGSLRRQLGESEYRGENVAPLAHARVPEMAEAERVATTLRKALATHCRQCARCRFRKVA